MKGKPTSPFVNPEGLLLRRVGFNVGESENIAEVV
jgi:hypothetical protein